MMRFHLSVIANGFQLLAWALALTVLIMTNQMLVTALHRGSDLEEEGESDDGRLETMLTHSLVADVCTLAVPTVQKRLDQDII